MGLILVTVLVVSYKFNFIPLHLTSAIYFFFVLKLAKLNY